MPPGGSERLDPRTAASEQAILALRTDRGVSAQSASDPRFRETLEWAREHGLVEPGGASRIVLTTRGRLLSNELFSRIV